MAYLRILESELHRFQIELSFEQRTKLAAYCDELNRWNKRLNLTALNGADLVRRLVVEPAWIGRELDLGGVLVDVGSGNGSPAMPLQIVCRLAACHLVEARARKVAFLRHIAAVLELPHSHIHCGRFEEVAPSELASVDWVTLQGVTLTDALLRSIRRIAMPTTKVVWITSNVVVGPLRPLTLLRVPFTDTQVFVFRLDQS